MRHDGRCMANDELRRLWIEIPKNASTSIKYNLNSNWTEQNWFDNSDLITYDAIAIIRDPKERWIKSWVELCDHKIHIPEFNLNKWLIETDFTDPTNWTDMHLVPQTEFLLGIFTPIKVVTMDKIDKSVLDFLELDELPVINKTEERKFKRMILSYFVELADTIDDTIKEFYYEDYRMFR